ncbi:MAG: hypothetical protein M3495_06570 [Pseudomonadota bacterium]|nr:hypothetical protein [Pseudomonadota bacterium]
MGTGVGDQATAVARRGGATGTVSSDGLGVWGGLQAVRAGAEARRQGGPGGLQGSGVSSGVGIPCLAVSAPVPVEVQ